MNMPYNAHAQDNTGFHIDIRFKESDKIYSVTNVKRISTIECIGLCIGAIAGCIVLARILKSCLGGSDYFQGLD